MAWMDKNTSNIFVYQTFDNYPESVFDLNMCPYQCIILYRRRYTLLLASPYPIIKSTNDIHTVWAGQFSTDGYWEYIRFIHPFQWAIDEVFESNFDVYTDATKTTLYFEKNVQNPLDTGGHSIARINI